MEHQQLVKEVIEQMSSRFCPAIQQIKVRFYPTVVCSSFLSALLFNWILFYFSYALIP